jgi:hypothetical protein
MIGDQAVARIQQGLGFMNRQASVILSRLQEAQKDFEKGKTLPKFLLQEDQTLTLLTGTSSVNLPAGFLRVDDDALPHYIDATNQTATFISIVRSFTEALRSNYDPDSNAPRVAVIRKSKIDFINEVSSTYTLTWNYYKADDVISGASENQWLANATDWIIGEAGYRMASDVHNVEAMAKFDRLRTQGRAAVFADIIASEEQSGPIMMGEDF